jgi:hypothetical protein
MKMKTLRIVFIALIFILFSMFSNAQKKQEIETLTKANAELTAKNDSLSGVVSSYTGMYNVLKDSVFKYQFDPAKTSFLIDSLRATRSAESALLSGSSQVSKDSVIMLMKENKTLSAKIDSLRRAWNDEKNAVPVISTEELKQLKELLDSKIISDSEFATLKKKYVEKL